MKMKLFLFLGLLALGAYSQENNISNVLLSEFKDYLEQQNITTYNIATRYCYGTADIYIQGEDKMCVMTETNYENYIVWQNEGKTYARKIDNCGFFKILELENNAIPEFVAANEKQLKEEVVKPYKAKVKIGGPVLRTEIFPCSRKYYFAIGETKFYKSFKQFDLESIESYPNINYSHNHQTKIIGLEALFNQAIAEMEKNNNFTRTLKLEITPEVSIAAPIFERDPNYGDLRDGY